MFVDADGKMTVSEPALNVPTEHKQAVRSMSFGAHDSVIFTTAYGTDTLLRTFNSRNGEEYDAVNTRQLENYSLAVSPDQRHASSRIITLQLPFLCCTLDESLH